MCRLSVLLLMLTTVIANARSSGSSWKHPDISKLPLPSSVLIACGQYRTLPGKAKDVACYLDATQGRYYRAQPGCIHYGHGVAAEVDDVALSYAVWSSKELFLSLPRHKEDQAKINEARAPAMKWIEGGSFDKGATYFITDQTYTGTTTAPPDDDATFPTFDEIFSKEHPVDPSKTIDSDIFMSSAKVIDNNNSILNFCKGIEATNGDYYRNREGCLCYGIGIVEDDSDLNSRNTAILFCLFDSKARFDALPEPFDVELLTKNRQQWYDKMTIEEYYSSKLTVLNPP